jgi:flagellar motility protein MotE (MotC chaperone)
VKAVVVISTITFLIIFGVLVLTTGLVNDLGGLLRNTTVSQVDTRAEDDANDRVRENLAQERDKLQAQLERINNRALQADVEEKTIDDQQKKLYEIISELKTLQKEYTDERDQSVQKLAKVYEAMKPDKAAPILASMKIDDVLQIMSRMKERQAAKILTNMNTGMASELSTRLGMKGDRQ